MVLFSSEAYRYVRSPILHSVLSSVLTMPSEEYSPCGCVYCWQSAQLVAEDNAMRVVQAILEDFARKFEGLAVLYGRLVWIVVVGVFFPYDAEPMYQGWRGSIYNVHEP